MQRWAGVVANGEEGHVYLATLQTGRKTASLRGGKRLRLPVSEGNEDSYKICPRLSSPTSNKAMLLTHAHTHTHKYNGI